MPPRHLHAPRGPARAAGALGDPLQPTRHPGHFDLRFIRHLAGLTRIYWTSKDAKRGAPLLALCVAMELGLVYANVNLAWANSKVFDAVQGKQWPRFVEAIEIFLGVALVVVLISTYRIYVRNILQIRWREHMTAYFVDGWIGPYAYGHAQLHHRDTDNPDQRISEDIQSYVASALGLSLSLLSAVATLISFSGVLWRLSGTWPLRIGEHEFWIPGLMMWVAILYSIVSMYLTHKVGKTLVGINFDRLRFEADFRYGLVRFRDHTEAVALARGQAVERRIAMSRFHAVITNWWDLITKQRNLTMLTGGIGQANGIVPLLMAAPGFFSGLMTLGTVVQVRFAYGQVSGALIWFVNAYQEIARWRANVERLASFEEVMEEADEDIAHARIHVMAGPPGKLQLKGVSLRDPHGRSLIEDINVAVQKGDRVAISGPSGTGKTTLLRAIAGVWPYGSGRIDLPDAERMLFVPQRPYLPNGTLRAVVSYPASEGSHSDARIREALHQVGLDVLADRLDAVESWAQQLTPAEQQRLGIARVLINEPAWIFLDKATSALDEDLERRIYELLAERLPQSTLISIAHRIEINSHHGRRWTIVPTEGGRSELRPE